MLSKKRTGKKKSLIAFGACVAVALLALGGVALAGVTTGSSGGIDFASAGSASQPPAPPPAPAPPAPDVTPPSIATFGGPKKISIKKRAKFTFSANEAASFRCKVDGREYAPCTSPFTAPKLGAGHHVFYVQAVDAAGNPSLVKQAGFSVQKPKHKKH